MNTYNYLIISKLYMIIRIIRGKDTPQKIELKQLKLKRLAELSFI